MTSLKSLLKWPRNTSQILLLLTVLLGTFYLIQTSHLLSVAKIKHGRNIDENDEAQAGDSPLLKNSNKIFFQGEKLVHLDLKGAPPKISYLVEFLPYIKTLGATGILIEYEDMFPYHDELENITALNAYTPSDIATIIQTAEINNLTVIPLVQTFGHFEFVLKLEQYKELREVEYSPQTLCPSHENVYVTLKKMIDQVLQAHSTSKYLHIGCDEAEFIGFCPRCQKLLRENRWRKDHIYFRHVKKIAEYIIENYPGVQPIIWSDRFVAQNENIILLYSINQLVEVMMWNYSPRKDYYPSKDDMEVLKRLFKNIWIANAFKGATGSTQIVTNIDYHIQNTRGWMEFVSEWRTAINFKGIALTGWQRYNHFTVLCELLPVGIPSLAMNLQYLNSSEKEVFQDFDYEVKQQILNCSNLVPVNLLLMKNLMMLSDLKCKFPGFNVYYIIHSFYNVLLRLASSLESLSAAQFSFYNIVHNSTNPGHARDLNINTYERYLLEMNDYRDEIRDALMEIYDEYTINEWITTHLAPAQLRLEAAINIIKGIHNLKVWPRRPFANFEWKAKNLFDAICTKTETIGCAFFNIH